MPGFLPESGLANENEDFSRRKENSSRMREYLEPGEQVRLEERPHPAALLRPLARSVALAVVGAILVLAAPASLGLIGALLLAFGAILSLGAVWRWDRTQLVVTTDKLFVVYGVAQRRAAAVRLARVGPVEMEQGVLGRALGYGTVIAGDLEIPFVPDPARVCSLGG
jgi:Bacterial PH domain